jgi:predicted dinucleotide-binding enzyme
MSYTGTHAKGFIEQMEEAFRPRKRRTTRTSAREVEQFHTDHPVRPIASSTISRAAYFRRPEVQNAFDTVESSSVDDDTKRELRSVMLMIVSELASMNEQIESITESVGEVRIDIEKLHHRLDNP